MYWKQSGSNYRAVREVPPPTIVQSKELMECSKDTHVNGEKPIISPLPTRRFAKYQSLREQPQQHALGEEHESLPIDREDTTS